MNIIRYYSWLNSTALNLKNINRKQGKTKCTDNIYLDNILLINFNFEKERWYIFIQMIFFSTLFYYFMRFFFHFDILLFVIFLFSYFSIF